MHVVACPADGERPYLILFRNASQIWPEPFAQIRGEASFAIFRAPNAMDEATRERMHNRLFLSSLPGLESFYITIDPALKRWATV